MPGEALETMVELCFWPSIVLVHKLVIYCNYILYILCTTDFYLLGQNVKPSVIPSKSHSAAVFINLEEPGRLPSPTRINLFFLHSVHQ